jgi:enoyl-CoA hydratase/carnithine racemase
MESVSGAMKLLSSAALRELRSEIDAFEGETFIYRVTRAAGADMKEMAQFDAWQALEFARLGQETFAAIERMPCVTIAAIDGDCFGGALDLVLAFDLRFATERSRFAHPGAKLGIVTGFGGTSRWRRVIDRATANRLFLRNEVFNAHDALEAGLVEGIGEPQIPDVDPMTMRFVKELSLHGDRLGRRDLDLLAQRLGNIYFRR